MRSGKIAWRLRLQVTIKGLSAAVNPIPMTIGSGMNFVASQKCFPEMQSRSESLAPLQLGTSRMDTHFGKLWFLLSSLSTTLALKRLERTHERAW